ncbi:MAG: gliding motility-associated C-terminal domain-containing protein [Bacteroidales bacterium]
MNRIIAIFILIFIQLQAIGQISFSGNLYSIYIDTPAITTGLSDIYVLHETDQVSISYTTNNSSVKWYSFSSLGATYANQITSNITYSGNTSTLSLITPNSGYIIEDGSETIYFWVVDYSDYQLTIEDISVDNSYQECGMTKVDVTASAKTITYYTILGESKSLSRDLTISYNTLEWDSEELTFNEIETSTIEESVSSSYYLTAPLCNTTFTILGDRFQEYWGEATTIESDTYLTNSVSVMATATEDGEDIDISTTTLSGSAPFEVNLVSYNSDAVTHNEWQISTTSDFSEIESRFYETEKLQTFNQAGTFYVKYIGTNSDGTCSSESDIFTISISESSLLVPNAFSPTSSEGVNDIWKPSYKSIVKYSCWIFNRWGVELFYSNDPSQGWDGTYKGKQVGSGAYFYVIDAKGADGIEYKLKGDVNIINYKNIY